jgi:hypothetical protein
MHGPSDRFTYHLPNTPEIFTTSSFPNFKMLFHVYTECRLEFAISELDLHWDASDQGRRISRRLLERSGHRN